MSVLLIQHGNVPLVIDLGISSSNSLIIKPEQEGDDDLGLWELLSVVIMQVLA